jgi:multiple sugar transport system ATP-binding protein
MRVEMKKLHQQVQTTTIYVTHDQVEAMTLADRIVIMKDGKIEQIGSPDEVYHKPNSQFVASFIGSPAMNFFSGTLEVLDNMHFLRCDGGETIDLVDWPDLIGSKLTMGIRPEHMELKTEKSSKGITTVLDAKVSVLEPMGHEVIVTCDSNIGEVIGKYTDNTKLKVGQTIHFEFKKENIHFFDEISGKRVS